MEQRFGDLIIRLSNGISHRRMYFDAHPRVVAVSREAAAELAAVLRGNGESTFSFGVFGGKFVRHGHYLVGPSIAGRALVDFAERLHCGGFTFDAKVTAADLIAFFRLGAERGVAFTGLDEARIAFAREGLGHIGLAPPLAEVGPVDAEVHADAMAAACGKGDFEPLVDIYQAMYDAVSKNALAVNDSGAIDVDRALAAGAGLISLNTGGALDVMQFLRYPDYDSYTIGHSVRVAALSTLIGRKLGWSEPVLTELAAAGLLHDVGKGRIPAEILFKPGRLDEAERRVVEAHPETGARILLDNGERSALIMAATWGHHLRHDGGGYPRRPAWHLPGVVAELVHVCDVFEALTARRPYKRPLSPACAFELMLGDIDGFHPRLLAALIEVLGLYPPGSEVRLSDGRRAVVVTRGKALDRPRVRATHDQGGVPLAHELQPALDLDRAPDLSVTELLTVGIGDCPATGS
ncbi:MAG: HD domain-containing protein [bacterium]|nr:HD domain-containing protein [bacterium]